MPTRITRERLQARLAQDRGLVLVEALGAEYYADAHLPGAINIPPGQVERLAPQLIPDRDVPIVVYCRRSGSSANAVARRLESVGYSDVTVYPGGKEEWVEHGHDVERSVGPDTPE